MPQLSQRANRLPASPIRKLVPYAECAKARGINVFHLNIGQPDIPTPPQFFQAIQDANIEVVAYSHSAGMIELRRAIANYYQGIGHSLTTEQVLVTTGASEALSFVIAATLNPGDEVIVPEPFYANYNSFTIAQDTKVVPVTTRIEDHFALPEISAFEEKITERTKAILICNPGNPTGVLYPREALLQLEEICHKHNLFLIADEVYREFAYDGSSHTSILDLERLADHAIVVDSISKRFSACGARIGCVVSRNEHLMNAILKMGQARLCSPAIDQIGATALYNLPASYYEQVIAEYATRRDTLKEELAKLPGVECPDINGAFYALVRLPVESAEDFCQWMLESFDYNGNTVMMAPAAGFYATRGLGQNEVRIAYVLNRDDLKTAVECLGVALKTYAESRAISVD